MRGIMICPGTYTTTYISAAPNAAGVGLSLNNIDGAATKARVSRWCDNVISTLR
jgi:hypothetical protein